MRCASRPEGGYAKLGSRLHDGVPHIFAILGREVDFPACFPYEADTQQEARDSGNVALGGAHIAEISSGKVNAGELAQGFAGIGGQRR